MDIKIGSTGFVLQCRGDAANQSSRDNHCFPFNGTGGSSRGALMAGSIACALQRLGDWDFGPDGAKILTHLRANQFQFILEEFAAAERTTYGFFDRDSVRLAAKTADLSGETRFAVVMHEFGHVLFCADGRRFAHAGLEEEAVDQWVEARGCYPFALHDECLGIVRQSEVPSVKAMAPQLRQPGGRYAADYFSGPLRTAAHAQASSRQASGREFPDATRHLDYVGHERLAVLQGMLANEDWTGLDSKHADLCRQEMQLHAALTGGAA